MIVTSQLHCRYDPKYHIMLYAGSLIMSWPSPDKLAYVGHLETIIEGIWTQKYDHSSPRESC